MTGHETDYDGPWKEILDRWLEPFLAFLFPTIHDAIDWSQGVEPLDTELGRLGIRDRTGRRHVDQLMRVHLRDGRRMRVLIHIEIQGRAGLAFPRRVFDYHVRLVQHYNEPVVSLALLTDPAGPRREGRFRQELWGCGLDFWFPVVHLRDLEARWEQLEAAESPVATVVMAQLLAHRTRGSARVRKARKLALTECLLRRRPAEAAELLRFVDWMMHLPEELDREYWADVARMEEDVMTYLTRPEREMCERVRAEEALEAVRTALEVRFGTAGEELMDLVRRNQDPGRLREVHRLVLTSGSLHEVRAALDEAAEKR